MYATGRVILEFFHDEDLTEVIPRSTRVEENTARSSIGTTYIFRRRNGNPRDRSTGSIDIHLLFLHKASSVTARPSDVVKGPGRCPGVWYFRFWYGWPASKPL